MRNFNKLTDKIIKNLQPEEKDYKLFDGKGLYINVTPAGGKYWRLKYRYGWSQIALAPKQKTYTIGSYPATSIKEARKKCIEVLQQVKDGVDPSCEKKVLKAKKKSEIYSSKEIKNTIEVIDKQIKIHERAIEILNSSKQKINLIK